MLRRALLILTLSVAACTNQAAQIGAEFSGARFSLSFDYCNFVDNSLTTQALAACREIVNHVAVCLAYAKRDHLAQRAKSDSVDRQLHLFSAYGSTIEGWKGLSPGWSPTKARDAERQGSSGFQAAIANSGDGAMAALQVREMMQAGLGLGATVVPATQAPAGSLIALQQAAISNGMDPDDFTILVTAALGATGHGPLAP